MLGKNITQNAVRWKEGERWNVANFAFAELSLDKCID
jgi:hypothetical protein